ncbi:MAG TPA: proprotein convertase P-domain-containing protein [Phycisphaerae bacterium]|nr:proprotein convertase P-domain-containing protein [Phycisphaerae bacterium]
MRPFFESLERRELLSAALPGVKLPHKLPKPSKTPAVTAHSTLALPYNSASASAQATPAANWFTPTQLRHAYGMDQVAFGAITGDGAGQTIAIIVAYHSPNIFSDLQSFSSYFNLPQLAAYTAGINTPYFRQVAQDGSQNFPTTANAPVNGVTWQMEAAMDVEWAHAMAPAANIILVEASSNGFTDLIFSGVDWARRQPGVSAISMSFGSTEFGNQSLFDSFFATPTGHTGISFIASTGDAGSPAQFPATSAKVIGLGGTSLTLDADGNYLGETGWSGSGGGVSTQVAKPSYQSAISLGGTMRDSPDLSLVSDPNTGVAVFESFDFPGNSWFQIGGTSLAAPMFAGMIAVANQGRNVLGLPTLDGPTQTLSKLYALPAADFHDVTQGSNGGFAAGVGYDLVTGLGTPLANLLVPNLVGVIGSISGRAYADNNGNSIFDAGDVPQAGVPVFLDTNGNGILDTSGTQSVSSGSLTLAIPDNNTNGATSSITMAGLGGTITKITVSLNITHQRDSNLTVSLIGPDNTQITLFSGIGGTNGANFNNTILSDSASTLISAGVAPFAGTFKPITALSTFNGKAPNGIWKIKIVDSVSTKTGTLTSWSISINTGSENVVLTSADGTYSFNPILGGTYNVREVPPLNYAQAGPTGANVSIGGPTTGVDFVNQFSTFTSTATANSYYLWRDQGMLNVGAAPGVSLFQYSSLTAPVLHFNLSTAGGTLIVDYSGGSPLPAQNIIVNGSGLADSQILILGAGSTLTMTDFQIGTPAGNILYSGVGIMTLRDGYYNYSGTLSTLRNLLIDSGAFMVWS